MSLYYLGSFALIGVLLAGLSVVPLARLPRIVDSRHPDLFNLLLALICGPILFTVVTCWTLIPIMALAVGGPLFVLVGFPVLALALRRYEPSPMVFAICAVLSLVVLAIPAAAFGADTDEMPTILGLCCLFGALWAAMSGWLYRLLVLLSLSSTKGVF